MDVMGSANNLKPPFFKPIFGLIFIDEAPACNPDIKVTSPVAERLQSSYNLRIFVEVLSYKAFIKLEAPRNSDGFQSIEPMTRDVISLILGIPADSFDLDFAFKVASYIHSGVSRARTHSARTLKSLHSIPLKWYLRRGRFSWRRESYAHSLRFLL